MKRHIPKIYLSTLPWLVAFGIHVVLLFIPLSQSAKQETASKPGKIRVVQTTVQSVNPPKAESPLPIKRNASALVIPDPKPSVAPPKPQVSPQPSPTPKPTSQKARKSGSPSPQAVKQPKAIAKQEPKISANDLVVNLAKLPDTQPCEQVEGCWKSQKSQWRSVYAKVSEQITAQGYNVTELELEDDTGFKVSQISQNGTTKYYLHLLSTLEGTIYVLNPTQLSKDEIEHRVNAT